MTVTGTFMGSPSYMSPEQIRGRDIDLRSDLYSLSVLFYEVVTGRLPIRRRDHTRCRFEDHGRQLHPSALLVPGLPLALNELIVRGMARNPSERCPDCSRVRHPDCTGLNGFWALTRAISSSSVTSKTATVTMPALPHRKPDQRLPRNSLQSAAAPVTPLLNAAFSKRSAVSCSSQRKLSIRV